jgi:alpha-aminoadipate carrier protein LysW
MSREGECPICGAEVRLGDDVIKYELIICSECGTDLEIVKINPLILEEAPQEEEDWGE